MKFQSSLNFLRQHRLAVVTVVVGLISLALIFAARYFDRARYDAMREKETARTTSLPINTSQAPAPSRPVMLAPTENRRRVAPLASPLESPAKAIFYGAKSMAEAYRQLSALGPTPEATYYQGRAVEACARRDVAGTEIFRAVIEQTAKSEPERLARLAALRRLATFCEGVPSEISSGTKESFSEQLFARAAQSGDIRARVRLLALGDGGLDNSPQRIGLITDLAKQIDGEAMDQLAWYFFLRSQSSVLWRIPGIDGEVSGQEIGNAWRLAACDYGANCAPWLPRSAGRCVQSGQCAESDLRAEILQQSPAPDYTSRLAAIRAVIDLGMQSGVWPERFWTGTNRPSR